MDLGEFIAYMMMSGGGAVLAQIFSNLVCGDACNTYLGYYPWGLP